uniref:Uncharacterized protein n=1 Tax=Anguilla anguilla TaxID=7936 RepID=A0A0E9WZH4_ANGAN
MQIWDSKLIVKQYDCDPKGQFFLCHRFQICVMFVSMVTALLF